MNWKKGAAAIASATACLLGFWALHDVILHAKAKHTLPRQKLSPPAKWHIREFQSRNPEDVWIRSAEGLRLHAALLRQSGHKWVILVHGYRGEGMELADAANFFYKQGASVLVISQRAHLVSDGKHITMGLKESQDVAAWMDWIAAKDPAANILLYGVSMGAATVMLAAGKHPSPHLKGVIADCGYTSAWEQFAWQLKKRTGLPAFPILHLFSLTSKLISGLSLKKASPIRHIDKLNVPILLIHGQEDDFVPAYMAYRLYEQASGDKQLFLVPGAGHAKARFFNPDLYYRQISLWLEHLKEMEE
jgi:hypothetical protein